MLALIDKGFSRQKAYELVQRNAMKVWKSRRRFLTQLKNDSEITAKVMVNELESLFDYNYYLRYADEIFKRLGLTETQWQGTRSESAKSINIAPRRV